LLATLRPHETHATHEIVSSEFWKSIVFKVFMGEKLEHWEDQIYSFEIPSTEAAKITTGFKHIVRVWNDAHKVNELINTKRELILRCLTQSMEPDDYVEVEKIWPPHFDEATYILSKPFWEGAVIKHCTYRDGVCIAKPWEEDLCHHIPTPELKLIVDRLTEQGVIPIYLYSEDEPAAAAVQTEQTPAAESVETEPAPATAEAKPAPAPSAEAEPLPEPADGVQPVKIVIADHPYPADEGIDPER
jgi:hypothetical protein